MTSRSCKLEPAIWSRYTGQRIPCFDRCQLIITWMSNVKEVHGKPRLHVSVNLLFGVWPPCWATPSPSERNQNKQNTILISFSLVQIINDAKTISHKTPIIQVKFWLKCQRNKLMLVMKQQFTRQKTCYVVSTKRQRTPTRA